VNHLTHQVTLHFLRKCAKRGVGEVVVGNLPGLREGLDYGKALNKLVKVLRYRGALMGISVHEVEERKTSITCHACGKALSFNRKHRGLYTCPCGWKAQADVNGTLKICGRGFQPPDLSGEGCRTGSVMGFLHPLFSVEPLPRRL